jgi:hypothetical protein
MIKRFIHLSLLTLLFSYTSQGQKLKRYDDLLLFKDAQSQQPIIIINDSLVYKGKQLIPFKHTEYPDKISEYLPFEIGKKTYLVHQACGPVLEFRNDSIVRIDHSFLHKNQYYPVPFTYNNEIYLFGGYGLFTYKNIITRYDFKSGEWNQVQTRGNNIPEPRAVAYSLLQGNTLYVFGGKTEDENNIPKYKTVQPELWKLDLPTMTWSYVGPYNPTLLTDSDIRIQYKDKLYIIEGYITELDFTKQTATKYSFKTYEDIKKHIIINDTIYGIFSNSQNKYYFKKMTIADLKGKFISATTFFEQDTTADFDYTTTGLIVLVIVVLLSIGYKKRIILFSKPFKGIVFDSQKEVFLHNKKTIIHFEENEKKVLYFLLNHIDQFVSLNQLNELFENPTQPETQSAIIKRREQAVNGLLNKVSKFTGISEEELLLERKNLEDKRLKDLLLLPQLLKKM